MASDDGEMWKAIKREQQQKRNEREQRDVPKLRALCDDGHLVAAPLGDPCGWRVRLPSAQWTVDYWPRSGAVMYFGVKHYASNPRELWRRMQQWQRERGE